jgi:N-acetyl-alpha-D-muramate 1-phosphate uridylyltransferase
LTEHVPKPLLEVGGKPLVVWQIEALVAAGIVDLVVNRAWQGDALEAAIGDGARWGARVAWSREDPAFETAGGIATALPLLEADGHANEPFAVISADIHADFDYRRLAPVAEAIRTHHPLHAAHLVLVPNPPWHPAGDMALVDGLIARAVPAAAPAAPLLTYANIGVFHPRVFDAVPRHHVQKLFPWAYTLADARRMTGEVHGGAWANVGTPDQVVELDRRLRNA